MHRKTVQKASFLSSASLSQFIEENYFRLLQDAALSIFVHELEYVFSAKFHSNWVLQQNPE